jgi:predicted dinucleotide-binding enzyme
MKIAVLGTGDVGRALGKAFLALGHEVKMGAREAGNEKAAAWVKESGPKASAGTFAEAAAFGERVVLATLGSVVESAITQAGPEHLAGKLVIDATNPLDFSTGAAKLMYGVGDSAGERAQRAAPKAKVVKAFNTVGNALMFRPQLQGGPPSMFICGDDEAAKQETTALLKEFGWEAVDAGGMDGAHYLEAMCLVWVRVAFKSGAWNHAFKLLRG